MAWSVRIRQELRHEYGAVAAGKKARRGQILDAESWAQAELSYRLGGKGDFEHNDLNHHTAHYNLMR